MIDWAFVVAPAWRRESRAREIIVISVPEAIQSLVSLGCMEEGASEAADTLLR